MHNCDRSREPRIDEKGDGLCGDRLVVCSNNGMQTTPARRDWQLRLACCQPIWPVRPLKMDSTGPVSVRKGFDRAQIENDLLECIWLSHQKCIRARVVLPVS